MPAKDLYHNAVKNALVKDGWTITDDPYIIEWGARKLYIDLGAEQLLAAEKSNERIAVEIKSFLGRSLMDDLERALGQMVLYRTILSSSEPDRRLFLAIPLDILELFDDPIGQLLVKSNMIRAICFDPVKEEIVQWLP
ncbi:MAG TPA: element excision factor XisH family protein [Gemmataceae bacterium]|nr:element excision factor XisH family protein [Gemmataceae bacterium]